MMFKSTLFAAVASALLASARVMPEASDVSTHIHAGRFPLLSCTLGASQESCHSAFPIAGNSSGTCCYNGALTPGGKESGLTNNTSINPGPANSTTVHGIWPDYCDGTYPQFCTNVSGIPEYNGTQIRAVLAKYDPKLLAYMEKTWTDYANPDPSDFWSHEYNKHGTCFSTLRASCQIPRRGISVEDQVVLGFFQEAVKRFKELPTLKWLAKAGIVQSDTALYNLTDVLAVLKKNYGATPHVGCASGTNRLSEVSLTNPKCRLQTQLLKDPSRWQFWFYANTFGPLIGAIYEPVETTFNATCPPLVSLPVKYNATAPVSP
ncbi:hypothetical protein OC846_005445 [Tilletia horrida]|uniref:ribonuclease T2 n=1 Tax=Tilletia horrida TaxID=155126 RepID=A0AAN6GQK6_9BASI|nr:hypothetical protein OC846_005445 [Tilletia horrida]